MKKIHIYTFLEDNISHRNLRIECIKSWKKYIQNAEVHVIAWDVSNPKEKYLTNHFKIMKDSTLYNEGGFQEGAWARKYFVDSLRIALPVVDNIENYLYMDSDIKLDNPVDPEVFEQPFFLSNGLGIVWSKQPTDIAALYNAYKNCTEDQVLENGFPLIDYKQLKKFGIEVIKPNKPFHVMHMALPVIKDRPYFYKFSDTVSLRVDGRVVLMNNKYKGILMEEYKKEYPNDFFGEDYIVSDPPGDVKSCFCENGDSIKILEDWKLEHQEEISQKILTKYMNDFAKSLLSTD